MRVLGTRRRVAAGEPAPEGVSRLESSDRLHALLGESDFVAVCCQLTAETEDVADLRAPDQAVGRRQPAPAARPDGARAPPPAPTVRGRHPPHALPPRQPRGEPPAP